MAENPFLGAIFLFAGNFAPRGYALCQGQTLSIDQNTALFSLLGTTYGGNGTTTFALPDLRGRAALSAGQAPGGSAYTLGEQGGTETVTLLTNQMPQHNHTIAANTQEQSNVATNNYLASSGAYAPSATTGTTLNPAAVSEVGGNQPHNNLQPYLTLNYIIALEGIFPSRN